MNVKKTGKLIVLVGAAAALVTTILKDKKMKSGDN
jgi:hypothetical protein